jgi:hypothetical protein
VSYLALLVIREYHTLTLRSAKTQLDSGQVVEILIQNPRKIWSDFRTGGKVLILG